MTHLGEFLRWRSADSCRTLASQFGKRRFNLLNPSAQAIIFRVRNLRRIILVIGDVMARQVFSQACMFGPRLKRCQANDIVSGRFGAGRLFHTAGLARRAAREKLPRASA